MIHNRGSKVREEVLDKGSGFAEDITRAMRFTGPQEGSGESWEGFKGP